MATPTPETWSLIKEEELATLWSERPCLFDITMPEYRDRVAKDRAMIEIAGKLAMTVEQIKTRMKSLRTQLGKVIKSPPSGSAAHHVTEKNKWILDRLQFLKPFQSKSKTQTNLLVPDDGQHDGGSDDNDSSILDEEQISSPAIKHTIQEKRMPTKVFKKRKEEKEAAVLDGLCQFLENETKKDIEQSSKSCEQSEADLFGALIAKSLQKFDNRTQSILKHHFQDLIFKAEMGELQNYQITPVVPPQSFQNQNMYQPPVAPHGNYGQERTNVFGVIGDAMQHY